MSGIAAIDDATAEKVDHHSYHACLLRTLHPRLNTAPFLSSVSRAALVLHGTSRCVIYTQEEEGPTAPPLIVDEDPPSTGGWYPNAVSVKDILQVTSTQAALCTLTCKHMGPEPLRQHNLCTHASVAH